MRLTVREVQVAGAAADVASVDDRVVHRRGVPHPAGRAARGPRLRGARRPARRRAARLMGKSTGATQSLLYRARAGFRQAFREDPTDG